MSDVNFIPSIKADRVNPAKHNISYKLCPWMHRARRTELLNINFLALPKGEI